MARPVGLLALAVKASGHCLYKNPIVFAPMLIASVLVALGERWLRVDTVQWSVQIIWFMAFSSVLSLWFQLWSLVLAWAGSLSEEPNGMACMRQASSVYWRMLAVLGVWGVPVAGVYSMVAADPAERWQQWGLLGPGFIWALVIFVITQFIPVIMIVERCTLGPAFKKLNQLLKLQFRAVFQLLLWVLASFLLVTALSVLLSGIAFLPPLVQGLGSAWILTTSLFYYRHMTQVDTLVE